MAICRTFQGFCSLFLGYIDLFIAYLFLGFATLSFFFKMIIGPFNALLVHLDSYLIKISTRKISNVRCELFRLLQFDGELLDMGANSRREVIEGESFRGPTFSRRESTLSIDSGAITGYTENTGITERADANLEGDNTSIATKNLQNALKEEKSAHAALRRELQKERRAAATAAEEAMAMILRLQEEKAAIEMEARQYKAVAEGKAKYEEEEIEILEEILIKREREKHILEKEVEAYIQIFGSMDDKEEKDGNFSDNANNEHKDGNEINTEFQEKDMVTTQIFSRTPSSSDGTYGFLDIEFSKKYSHNESSKKGEDDKLENNVYNNVHDVHIINDGSA